MSDFLWEIGCEEIPARMQKQAIETLERLIKAHGKQVGFQDLRIYCTPRHLAAHMRTVAPVGGVAEIKQGPCVDLGEKALAGFCRTWSLDPKDCYQLETPKGMAWGATIAPKEQSVETLLIDLCTGVLKEMFWPKRMRWSNAVSWIRPIRWMVALYEQRVLDWTWNDLVASDWSEGHRLLGAQHIFSSVVGQSLVKKEGLARLGIRITSPETYVDCLADAGVILDHQVRQELIRKDIHNLAATCGGRVYADTLTPLIEENAGLTQWPHGILCSFDPKFLALPLEVIVTTLQVHQKCFCVQACADEALLPYFIMIADGPLPSEHVAKGYERVVSARLEDALFFWNQDLKMPLEGRLDGLRKRSFFQQLGTLYDKTQRVQNIMGFIAQEMDQPIHVAQQAGLLSKCDLLTAMVGEFPTLQGTMGRYYGAQQGCSAPVALALQECYTYPRADLETLKKQGSLGAALAIADGIDTLVGFFALRRVPSGSKDPMALRRACHGVIKAMVAQKIDLHFTGLIRFVLAAYQEQGFLVDIQADVLTDTLGSFFQDRLIYLIKESGMLANSPAIKALVALFRSGLSVVELWDHGVHLDLLMVQHPDFLAAYRRLYALVHQMSDQAVTTVWDSLDSHWEAVLIDLLNQPMTIGQLPLWTIGLHGFFDHVTVQDAENTPARLGLLRAVMAHCQALGPLAVLMEAS
jgi:glycyl-tRNA synthetase beta chain